MHLTCQMKWKNKLNSGSNPPTHIYIKNKKNEVKKIIIESKRRDS